MPRATSGVRFESLAVAVIKANLIPGYSLAVHIPERIKVIRLVPVSESQNYFSIAVALKGRRRAFYLFGMYAKMK